jgi:hypothetical protein
MHFNSSSSLTMTLKKTGESVLPQYDLPEKQSTIAKKALLLLLVICCTANSQWNAEGIPVMDTSTSQNYLYPEIVTDGKGGCYVIWNDFRNGTDHNVYVQRLDKSGKEIYPHNGIAVETAPGFQQTNLCLGDGNGGIFATWSDSRDGQNNYIYAQHMDSNGTMLWQPNGIKVSDKQGFSSQVVSDRAGGIIINYCPDFEVVMQRIDSSGNRMWGDSGISQSNNEIFVYYMLNASDGKGGVIVSWIEDSAIYAQRIRHDGSVAWKQNGIKLSLVDTTRSIINIVEDGNFGAIISWTTGSRVEVRAQRVDSNGTILWGNNGVHIGIGGSGPGYLVADQKGGAIIPVGKPGILKLFRVRADGSQIWSNGATVPTSFDQIYMVSDNASGAIVVSSGQNGSIQDDIFAQRIDSSGIARWNPGGIVISNFSSDKLHPAAVSDGRGGVLSRLGR